ncbi:MAG: C39 family peptidase [Ruminococcus sp.]|nr:C39 family peptidase [Ruminococcus sp.]
MKRALAVLTAGMTAVMLFGCSGEAFPDELYAEPQESGYSAAQYDESEISEILENFQSGTQPLESEPEPPKNVEVQERNPQKRPSEVNVEEAAADELPEPDAEKAGCFDVPYISQEDYPTGCELVSASMLLAYHGIEIEPGELIDGGYVETADFVPDSDDPHIVYGGDPNYSYIGDPRDESGYGCYGGAISDGLELLLDGKCFNVANLTGKSLDYICEFYLDLGEPVLVWISLNMEPLEYIEGAEWRIRETGEEFQWLSNEHCVVLVGCDENYYYFNDPTNGKNYPFEKELTEKRFEEMGCQAVTIRPWY